jgi:3(or 17)beta-hydroxysteroid dehydrogenase
MGRVKDKVALVTGAESADGEFVGLGRASALLLAGEGAKVVATDIVPGSQGSVAEEIRDGGGEAIAVRHDVTSEADWEAAVAAALEAFGRLDIVVNMAGASQVGSIEETSLADWRSLMAVNLDGVFLGTKHGIRAIKQSGGGSIVNTSSIYGSVGGGSIAAYSTSKAGVRNLTKSAALHCAAAGYGIRVNSIHPGYCQTPMYAKYWRGKSSLEDGVATDSAATPIGRIGQPADIAFGVLYLASDESSFMTGAELVIDGGFLAK